MSFLLKKKGDQRKNVKGQVTIFIIIAILIVSLVLIFFLMRSSLNVKRIPSNLEPVYNNLLDCITQDTRTGISILESQGGYIDLPAFEPGSGYMPFSSQLNFLGNRIPYWYYVSGNNIPRTQVPTKEKMQEQLGRYVTERISDCNFKTYYDQGFEISLQPISADTIIKDDNVEVNLNADFNIVKGSDSVSVKNHKVSVKSRLGSLYNSAKKVYDYQQKNSFLEEYAVDTLRLYAPVDGTEITCSPLIWKADDVFNELQEAIEANTITLNSNIGNGYFSLDLPVTDEVRFLNSKNWPNSFEVTPAEGNLLIANPIGNQQGLGILGFCYVPYHFVYSVKYPVLVQVKSGEEIFQFPIAIILQNNKPRNSLNITNTFSEEELSEICPYKNTEIQVSVRDRRGSPIKADILYECLENSCGIGQTSASGILNDKFPQCANGFVVAKAPGFKDARYLFDTISPGSLDIVMENLYPKTIQLKVDGINYNGDAIIYFNSEDSNQVVLYPSQKQVELAQGQYEIEVYIFRNSSINIGATTVQQCIDVLRPGILGILGFQQQRCFDINIPEQVISQALAGGGKQDYFILESELTSSGPGGAIEINAQSLPIPDSIQKLQNNYLLFENRRLDIIFR